jgi:uncharacterized membrane protein YhaH (DUF805 family)
MKWFVEAYRKYAVFKGRARRKEYWGFVLLNIIVLVLLINMDHMVNSPVTDAAIKLFIVASILPGLAVSVRRMHDINKSGWFLLITFIPFGNIFILFSLASEGSKGKNEYGPDPKKAGESASMHILDEDI